MPTPILIRKTQSRTQAAAVKTNCYPSQRRTQRLRLMPTVGPGISVLNPFDPTFSALGLDELIEPDLLPRSIIRPTPIPMPDKPLSERRKTRPKPGFHETDPHAQQLFKRRQGFSGYEPRRRRAGRRQNKCPAVQATAQRKFEPQRRPAGQVLVRKASFLAQRCSGPPHYNFAVQDMTKPTRPSMTSGLKSRGRT